MTDELRDELADGYDVVVLGGGAAGLNGALMLARARRSVVVVDAGARATPRPRRARAAGPGGHAARGTAGARPGRGPPLRRPRGGREVATVGAATVDGDGQEFTVALADGRSVRARRLLVATGLVDELPDLPGLRERWGHDVLHCPYCHGWEVRDQAVGVLASGPMSVHQALLFRQWSDDITYFTHTLAPPTDEQAEQLAARGVRVVTGEVAALETAEDRLVGVRLRDGTMVAREALAIAPRMSARAGFLAALGCARRNTLGAGEYVPVDASGRTDVPGVWAAGNVADLTAQVGAAAAAGAMAGAQINADLVAEETRRAVAAHRATTPGGPSTAV
ncbi:NAD(P)/FAD-dependent oxidoreductase [Streptomyces sp. M19]